MNNLNNLSFNGYNDLTFCMQAFVDGDLSPDQIFFTLKSMKVT